MGSRVCILMAALVVPTGCASEPGPERHIVGVCQAAVELQLSSGDFEYEVSSFESVDLKNGSQQMTGVVNAANGSYVFECETNARTQRTDLKVWQASIK